MGGAFIQPPYDDVGLRFQLALGHVPAVAYVRSANELAGRKLSQLGKSALLAKRKRSSLCFRLLWLDGLMHLLITLELLNIGP